MPDTMPKATATQPSGIVTDLRSLADGTYRGFSAKLIPNIDPDTIIGIRVPRLRMYAKALLSNDLSNGTKIVPRFLDDLPHQWFEENMLHAILIGLVSRNIEDALDRLDAFLPYVDNWAACDAIKITAFHSKKADADRIYRRLCLWIDEGGKTGHPYAIRYAVTTLMSEFLDDRRFKPEQLETVAAIRSDEYYVNMARAWYFATALTKQWDATIPLFRTDVLAHSRLDDWTHNKSIQKARESRRVSDERKAYLQSLKR